MEVMESSALQGMGSKLVAIRSSLLPVAMTGELSSQIMRVMEQ